MCYMSTSGFMVFLLVSDWFCVELWPQFLCESIDETSFLAQDELTMGSTTSVS